MFEKGLFPVEIAEYIFIMYDESLDVISPSMLTSPRAKLTGSRYHCCDEFVRLNGYQAASEPVEIALLYINLNVR